ncbi:HxxPF-repeated domain-containing protein, partial [Vibrio xiamenensis]
MKMMQKRAVTQNVSTQKTPNTITTIERDSPLALSFSQQRLWFIEQLDSSSSSAYHISGAVRIHGQLDLDALTFALNAIVERHEVLRTHFPARGEQPEQVIAKPSVGMPFEHFEVANEQQLNAQLQTLKQRAFDLEQGRLVRAALIELGEQQVLFLCLHHAIADGWSLGILLEELSALYNAKQQGAPSPLMPLSCQYADYAHWQREWLNSDAAKAQSDYWQTALAGAPELSGLPCDFSRPEKQSYAAERIELNFDKAFSAQLRAFSQRHGVTDYMVMLAAWSSLVARLSGQSDVVIGTPIANRTLPQTQAMIGFFANTLALRIDHSGSPSVSEFLVRIKAQNIEAQTHQDLPFDQVVEKLSPNRSLAHTPLFQMMFAWHDNSAGQLQLGDLSAQFVELEQAQTTVQFDVSLSLGWHQDQIQGDIRFASALYRRESIEEYLRCWRNLLQAWLLDDGQAIDQVALLSQGQIEQVTTGFNADKQSYPVTECIHQRFEAQVDAFPEHIAVSYQTHTLT